MGTREVYDYKQQKWVPYVSDPDKWYQHLLDIRDGLVEPDHPPRTLYRGQLREIQTPQRNGSKINRKTKTGGQFGVTRRSGNGDG